MRAGRRRGFGEAGRGGLNRCGPILFPNQEGRTRTGVVSAPKIESREPPSLQGNQSEREAAGRVGRNKCFVLGRKFGGNAGEPLLGASRGEGGRYHRRPSCWCRLSKDLQTHG